MEVVLSWISAAALIVTWPAAVIRSATFRMRLAGDTEIKYRSSSGHLAASSRGDSASCSSVNSIKLSRLTCGTGNAN